MSDLNFKEALAKGMASCSRRELSALEVLERVKKFELNPEQIKELISVLKKDNFLNHKRYAFSFTNDKFKFNHWGRVKIKNHLVHKGIEEEFIYEAQEVIDNKEYEGKIIDLANRKMKSLKEENLFLKKQKVIQHITQKGFETELTIQLISRQWPTL